MLTRQVTKEIHADGCPTLSGPVFWEAPAESRPFGYSPGRSRPETGSHSGAGGDGRRPPPSPIPMTPGSVREPDFWRALSDEELVLSATAGDFGAFDELVRRFRPAVLNVARRLVGREAAEDVAQDALLLAFKALPQLQEPGRFGLWLGAITRNRALRWAQRKSNRDSAAASEWDELILENTPHLGPLPEKTIERDETRDQVRAAVDQLPSTLGPVMVLYYYEDMPVSRIAGILGLTSTTVKWRLHQGRLALRRVLAKDLPVLAGSEEK